MPKKKSTIPAGALAVDAEEPNPTKSVMTEEKFDPSDRKPKAKDIPVAPTWPDNIQANPGALIEYEDRDILTMENCTWVQATNGRKVKCNRWHRRAGHSKGFIPCLPPGQ